MGQVLYDLDTMADHIMGLLSFDMRDEPYPQESCSNCGSYKPCFGGLLMLALSLSVKSSCLGRGYPSISLRDKAEGIKRIFYIFRRKMQIKLLDVYGKKMLYPGECK